MNDSICVTLRFLLFKLNKNGVSNKKNSVTAYNYVIYCTCTFSVTCRPST